MCLSIMYLFYVVIYIQWATSLNDSTAIALFDSVGSVLYVCVYVYSDAHVCLSRDQG